LDELGLDIDFSLGSPMANRYLAEKVSLFSSSVLSTKADQLRRTLTEGLANRESMQKLASRVQSVYDSVLTGGYQAEMIARTETIGSLNAGKMDAYSQGGVVQEKEWLSARSGNTRGAAASDQADHMHMDGQKVPMDVPFIDPRSGARMMFPGDISLGAGGKDIINCRCSMLGNLDVAEIKEEQNLEAPEVQKFIDGEIISSSKLNEDTFNDCSKVQIKNDGEGIFKPEISDRDAKLVTQLDKLDAKACPISKRSTLVTQLAKEIQLDDMYPHTMIKYNPITGGFGSCQIWIDDYANFESLSMERTKFIKDNIKDFKRAGAFEDIVNIQDRHRGNFGFSAVSRKPKFIDNDFSFSKRSLEDSTGLFQENKYYFDRAGFSIEQIRASKEYQSVVNRFVEKEKEIRVILVDGGLPKDEIDDMFFRISQVKK